MQHQEESGGVMHPSGEVCSQLWSSSLDAGSAVSALCPICFVCTHLNVKLSKIKLVSNPGNFDSYSDAWERQKRLQ